MNYTLDLNTGLTQVLADDTNIYLYGNGRISQSQVTNPQSPEYFLGDALGSVRQLADTAGAVTLTQSYAPYGEVTQSVGTSQTSYAFTGEARDANGLTFLRARYLDSSTGRFTQRDPSGLEANLYLYAQANPVNRIDPTGLFSDQQIADSFGHPNIETLLSIFYTVDQQAWTSFDPHYSRWGFFSALLDAENGDFIQSGNLTLSTLYPHVNYKAPERLWSTKGEGCGEIIVGNRRLEDYFKHVLAMPNWRELFVFWRNTSPRYYILSSNNQTKGYYIDGGGYTTGAKTTDLPDFHSIDIALYFPKVSFEGGASFIVDRYGNQYLSASGGKGKAAGVFYSEGYVCASPNECFHSGIPKSEEAVRGTVEKGCVGPAVALDAGWSYAVCNAGMTSAFIYSFGYGFSFSLDAGYSRWIGKNERMGWNNFLDAESNGVSWVDLLTKIKVKRRQ